MQELKQLSGTVCSVIYRNDENGYAVLRLESDDGETVTVVGCFPYIAPGENLTAEGSWMQHAQHGRQFKAESSIRQLPTNADSIYEYLSGGIVKGIGPATAALIVNKFGERSLDVLEMQPEKLAEIKGIGISKAKEMSRAFKRQAGVRRLMEFLCSYGIQPVFALRLYRFYGDSAIDIVHENPYIISASHIGADFAQADSLALELGIDSDSINRIAAAVAFELLHNSGNGHCFIPRDKLVAATGQLIDVNSDSVNEGVDKLISVGEIVCDMVAGHDSCYLRALHEAETYTAGRIKELSALRLKPVTDARERISRIELISGISYAPMQKKAIELAMNNSMLVITGGPGTGKTTIVKAVIHMFEDMGLDTCLAAPTGRAAKRMSELSGREASTIHRMLGAKMSEDGESVIFTKDESDPLSCDVLILDECSMVDILLMQAVLKALKPDCRLVLVGDADQLPSVGPGNVFSDIIRSGIVPTVRLTEIFRHGCSSFHTGQSERLPHDHFQHGDYAKRNHQSVFSGTA